MEKDKIKNKLVSLLGEADTNYSEVIKLSNELVKFDENYVRFSIDAANLPIPFWPALTRVYLSDTGL